MLLLHIVAGLMGLASGAVALYALKGAKLHRKSGMIFVYAMLFMSSSGAVMAALKPQRFNVIAGVLTSYLVITALLAVRRRVARFHWIELGAMLVALTVGIASVRLGSEALASATGQIDGLPAAPAFVFGAVALLAVLGDIRMMLGRGIQGAHRIARHLWRMCFALFIAAASFFLVEAEGGIPRPIRNLALLAIPVLLVLLLMLFWLARVLFTERYRRPDSASFPSFSSPTAGATTSASAVKASGFQWAIRRDKNFHRRHRPRQPAARIGGKIRRMISTPGPHASSGRGSPLRRETLRFRGPKPKPKIARNSTSCKH